MKKTELNDFITTIFQDFCEIESTLKILKDSATSENNEITMADIGNALEIIIAKTTNTKYSLDKYINTAF